jgi:virulence-associated protein VapD
MAQYAIAFDLNTRAMRQAGLTDAEITAVYQTEIPAALAGSGFTAHPQGSLYHTVAEHDPITAVMTLQSNLHNNAPRFCQYVRRVHVFRMEEWSDVTALIATEPCGAAQSPTPEEEIDEQEIVDLAEHM